MTLLDKKKEFLNIAFDHFNILLFDGKLPSCVVVASDISKFAKGSHCHMTSSVYPYKSISMIEIDRKLFHKETMCGVLKTLVHEMVHAWMLNFCEKDNAPHGIEFYEKCYEIGLPDRPKHLPKWKRKVLCSRYNHQVAQKQLDIDKCGKFYKAVESFPESFKNEWRDLFNVRENENIKYKKLLFCSSIITAHRWMSKKKIEIIHMKRFTRDFKGKNKQIEKAFNFKKLIPWVILLIIVLLMNIFK